MKNSAAISSLASRLSDAPFRLPLPYAPGGAFVGAMVRPGAFGLEGHADAGAAGRGLTPDRAFESCMGEAAEYLSFIERDEDPLLTARPAEHGLNQEELAWALEGAGLPADQDLDTLDWVKAVRLGTDATSWFPSELVLRRPEHRRTGSRPAESNGMGAGADWQQAVMSGLMEAVERDAAALWWFGGNEASLLEPHHLPGGGFEEFAREVRQDAERPHWLLDLTTGIGITAIAAVSSFPDGSASVAGLSAHPDPRRAAGSAFLEMCQMELAQQLSLMKREQQGAEGLTEVDRSWIDRHERLSTSTYPQLLGKPGQPPAWQIPSEGMALESSLNLLEAAGFAAYAVDLTRPEIGITAAKVLVPGLQSAKADWITSRLRAAAGQNGISLAGAAEKLSPI